MRTARAGSAEPPKSSIRFRTSSEGQTDPKIRLGLVVGVGASHAFSSSPRLVSAHSCSGRGGPSPEALSRIHASAEKMRHTGRVERATRFERCVRERAFGERPCLRTCATGRVGARPYNAVTQFVATTQSNAGWPSPLDWADDQAVSTWAASAAHAPCVRRDGDPDAARKSGVSRLRGDKAGRRPLLEEMRGFELVGTSSAAAPPGRTRALARVSIATGIALTQV